LWVKHSIHKNHLDSWSEKLKRPASRPFVEELQD